MFGFTAANMLLLLALAETICGFGRKMIDETSAIAVRVGQEMGFADCEVVYGDTDSVFLHLPGATDQQALDVGYKVHKECNRHFEIMTHSNIINLELETMKKPCLLIKAKTYAALEYEVLEHADGTLYLKEKPKKLKKGLRAVRRDTPIYVGKMQDEGMNLLLETQDAEVVKKFVHDKLLDLIQLRPSLQDMSISMALRALEDYKNKNLAHLKLLEKLTTRSKEGSLPQGCTLWRVGDRIPFYISESDHRLVAERAECPIYGAFHNIPYDRPHYVKLFCGALEQGLIVLDGMSEMVDSLVAEHLAHIEQELKARRKHRENELKLVTERAELARKGQKFLTDMNLVVTSSGASSSTKRPSSISSNVSVAPKRSKSVSIMSFLKPNDGNRD